MSDCLHCDLWSVINKFNKEHPGSSIEDMLMALANVIGDQLAGSARQNRDIDMVNRRIEERFNQSRERRGSA